MTHRSAWTEPGQARWDTEAMDEHNRHIDRENEWLWSLRARLIGEVKEVEQRITEITGIEDFK